MVVLVTWLGTRFEDVLGSLPRAFVLEMFDLLQHQFLKYSYVGHRDLSIDLLKFDDVSGLRLED